MGRLVALLLLLCSTSCMRRDGQNSDCTWPTENTIHEAGTRHLSADAEFAEDLAIRYADTHHGLRTPYYVSGEMYVASRDRCMGRLFEQVAKEHGVAVGDVSSALGHNRGYVDLAVNLPFVLFYFVVAAVVARVVWRRYPAKEFGWIPGIVMTLFLSLTLAAAGTLIGEMWNWFTEGMRVGNGHMSYRGQRLWFVQHRNVAFTGALIVFWLVSAAAAGLGIRS